MYRSVSVNRSSFSIWISFFSCLTALARTSSIMLNISSDNGHLCLILNLRKIFKPFTIKYYVSSGLVIRSLYYVEIHVFIYLKKRFIFFYFWLCWFFISVGWLSLVVVSGNCSVVAVQRLLIAVASLIVAHRVSCSEACGNFLDQGTNPCPQHLQADS